jgi:hypothetical protein
VTRGSQLKELNMEKYMAGSNAPPQNREIFLGIARRKFGFNMNSSVARGTPAIVNRQKHVRKWPIFKFRDGPVPIIRGAPRWYPNGIPPTRSEPANDNAETTVCSKQATVKAFKGKRRCAGFRRKELMKYFWSFKRQIYPDRENTSFRISSLHLVKCGTPCLVGVEIK